MNLIGYSRKQASFKYCPYCVTVAETTCRALRMLDPKSLTVRYSSDCSRGGCAGQWFSEDLAKIRASLKLFYLYNGSLYTTGNNGFQSGALSLVTDRILRVFQ